MDVPVKLGRMDSSDALGIALHNAAVTGNLKALKKTVTTGVNVDYPNNAGQTPLFLACCGNHFDAAKFLLEHGANPNEKSNDGVTPVHVASCTGNLKLFSKLVEMGGDLRLHDKLGQTAKDWAMMQANDRKRMKMLEYIDKIHLFAMTNSGREIAEKANDGIAGRRWSLIKMIKKKIGSATDFDNLQRKQSTGFGKVYTSGGTTGIISVIPLISENSLYEDQSGVNYANGGFFIMESFRWRNNVVTVKRLMQKSSKTGGFVDMLIQELEMMGKLRHPNQLLLMGLCQSVDLDQIMLIYERVGLGSLFFYLHERMERLPTNNIGDILEQICDALTYIHDQNLIHCSLSSHAIHLVTPFSAKLGNFEYMIESDKTGYKKSSPVSHLAHYSFLFNWMAPEVLMDQVPTFASDIYSYCCIAWEMFKSELPWKNLKPDAIKHTLGKEGIGLTIDPQKIPAPFTLIVSKGLQLNPADRLRSFYEIGSILYSQEMELPYERGECSNNNHDHKTAQDECLEECEDSNDSWTNTSEVSPEHVYPVLAKSEPSIVSAVSPAKFSYLSIQNPNFGPECFKPASHQIESRRSINQLSTAGTLMALYGDSLIMNGSTQPNTPRLSDCKSPASPRNYSPDRKEADSQQVIRQGSVRNLVSQFENYVQVHETNQAILQGQANSPHLSEGASADCLLDSTQSRHSPKIVRTAEASVGALTDCPLDSTPSRRSPKIVRTEEASVELPAFEHTFLYPRLNVPQDSFSPGRFGDGSSPAQQWTAAYNLNYKYQEGDENKGLLGEIWNALSTSRLTSTNQERSLWERLVTDTASPKIIWKSLQNPAKQVEDYSFSEDI